MTLLCWAKSSACEIKKALLFLIFISGWIAISIIPIHLDNSNSNNRTATLVLSIPPVPLTSFYILVAFVYVAFNKNKEDDSKINIIALLLILVTWVISWSALYLVFWSWDSSVFPKLPVITEAYEAWGYMISISAGIYVADQPLSADAVGVGLNLLMTVQSLASTFINFAVFATVVTITLSLINKKNEGMSKRMESSYEATPVYYQPFTPSQFPSNLSTSPTSSSSYAMTVGY